MTQQYHKHLLLALRIPFLLVLALLALLLVKNYGSSSLITYQAWSLKPDLPEGGEWVWVVAQDGDYGERKALYWLREKPWGIKEVGNENHYGTSYTLPFRGNTGEEAILLAEPFEMTFGKSGNSPAKK